MNHTAWMSMRSAMRSQDDLRPFSKATLKRIGGFAKPHMGKLVVFLVLSIITAVLAVATPVLAGRVVNAITEDAATSIRWHASRNPATGRRWASVYTPDVLAVGEGPSTWADYFVQQNRWARGTNEIVVRKGIRRVLRLPTRARPNRLLAASMLLLAAALLAFPFVSTLPQVYGYLVARCGTRALAEAYAPELTLRQASRLVRGSAPGREPR